MNLWTLAIISPKDFSASIHTSKAGAYLELIEQCDMLSHISRAARSLVCGAHILGNFEIVDDFLKNCCERQPDCSVERFTVEVHKDADSSTHDDLALESAKKETAHV